MLQLVILWPELVTFLNNNSPQALWDGGHQPEQQLLVLVDVPPSLGDHLPQGLLGLGLWSFNFVLDLIIAQTFTITQTSAISGA